MTKACLGAVALLLAACTSTSTFSGRSTTRASSPAPPTVTTASAASTSSSPVASGCVPGADYCDTFDDPDSGWPQQNPPHFYARYASADGGTYAMGERTNAAISEDAPYDIINAATDYSVQLDVDASPGPGFGVRDELGFACWEHPVQPGGSVTSAFLLQLSESKATIGLWDETDGSYHEIRSAAAPGALSPTGWTHLTGRCVLGNNAGSPLAELRLAVNGTPVVSASYAKTPTNYDWDIGERVGLLAIGDGSNVYYDNFAVTGRCTAAGC